MASEIGAVVMMKSEKIRRPDQRAAEGNRYFRAVTLIARTFGHGIESRGRGSDVFRGGSRNFLPDLRPKDGALASCAGRMASVPTIRKKKARSSRTNPGEFAGKGAFDSVMKKIERGEARGGFTADYFKLRGCAWPRAARRAQENRDTSSRGESKTYAPRP